MEAFPSQSERTVAEALLLLSSNPPSPILLHALSSPSFCFKQSFKRNSNSEEDESQSDSKSSSSSLISDGSTGDSRADQLRIHSVAARLHDIKLKVVRRSRSKHYRNFDRQKNLLSEWRNSVVMTWASSKETTEDSSLSSSSSSSLVYGAEPLNRGEKLNRQTFGSACLVRRAEAILKFLSVSCASEVRIRQVLGDSPDTSKALRRLLKLEEIKRSGAGGHRDPYVYMVVGPRSDVESA